MPEWLARSSSDAIEGLGVRLESAWQALLATPWPVTVALACAPFILALGSRRLVGVVGAGVLSALALLSILQGPEWNPSGQIAAFAYIGAILFALLGHRQRGLAKTAELMRGDVAAMRDELDRFVDALDKRALMIDTAAARWRTASEGQGGETDKP